MSCIDDFNDDELKTLRSWYKYATHWGYYTDKPDNQTNFEDAVHDTTNLLNLKRQKTIRESDVYPKISPANLNFFLECMESIVEDNDEARMVVQKYFYTEKGRAFANEIAPLRLTDESSLPWSVIVTCCQLLLGLVYSKDKEQYTKRKIRRLQKLYKEYDEN
jgi:hypothetical protein